MVGTWTCQEQPLPNRGLPASVAAARQEEEELPSLGIGEAGPLEVRVDAVDAVDGSILILLIRSNRG